MGHEVANNIHGIYQKLRIFNTNMNMGAEDKQLLRKDLHILLYTSVALEGCDLLVNPRRDRMRSSRGDLQPVATSQFHHAVAQADQFSTRFGCRVTYACSNFDNRLMQFRLD